MESTFIYSILKYHQLCELLKQKPMSARELCAAMNKSRTNILKMIREINSYNTHIDIIEQKYSFIDDSIESVEWIVKLEDMFMEFLTEPKIIQKNDFELMDYFNVDRRMIQKFRSYTNYHSFNFDGKNTQFVKPLYVLFDINELVLLDNRDMKNKSERIYVKGKFNYSKMTLIGENNLNLQCRLSSYSGQEDDQLECDLSKYYKLSEYDEKEIVMYGWYSGKESNTLTSCIPIFDINDINEFDKSFSRTYNQLLKMSVTIDKINKAINNDFMCSFMMFNSSIIKIEGKVIKEDDTYWLADSDAVNDRVKCQIVGYPDSIIKENAVVILIGTLEIHYASNSNEIQLKLVQMLLFTAK